MLAQLRIEPVASILEVELKHIAVDCRACTQEMSGVGRYVLNLVCGLVKTKAYHFSLLVRDDHHQQLRSLAGVDLVLTQEGPKPNGYQERLLWEQRVLPTLLRRLNPDLYHATWNYGIPLLSAVPSVVTLHDLLPFQLDSEFGSRSHKLCFTLSQYIALWKARRIVSVSDATRKELIGRYRTCAGKTQVILEGVEDKFHPAPDDVSKEYILYVGGGGHRKNIGNTLRAFQLLAERTDLGFPLHLTGRPERIDPESRSFYESLPQTIKKRIVFLGHIEEDRFPEIYRRAIVMVFPSFGEGFGFPPLEAMASATPVVTSAAGSLPEIVGEAGCIVDPHSPESIAQGLFNVIHDPSRRRDMIHAGLQRAKLFNWERAVDQTAQVYEQVLSSG